MGYPEVANLNLQEYLRIKAMSKFRKYLDNESMIHYIGFMLISLVVIGALTILYAST